MIAGLPVIDAVIIVTYLAALTTVGLYFYILAMFSRRATGSPTLLAGIVGTCTSYVVAYHSSIGFMWPSTFGLAATVVTGWALSRLLPARPTADALKLTWWQVMRREEAMVRA